MRGPATFIIPVVLTACRPTIHFDPVTGDPVSWPAGRSEPGEPGEVNPALITYIFTAPEGPFVRYYDLVLSLPGRSPTVNADLAALDVEARRGRAPGESPRARDYARALGRRLGPRIHDDLRSTNGRTGGAASVRWGVPVDLDAGIPRLGYECDPDAGTRATILRYQSLWLLVLHSSATRRLLAWDVSEVPGAFQWGARLDLPTVAAQIVALHPLEP